jgi:hypothetical protein
MKTRSRYIGIILLAIFLLTPYRTTSIPEWQIRLVNEDGSSARNLGVVQEWSHYSALGMRSEVRETDDSGQVIFPARDLYCPLAGRILLRTIDLLNNIAMPHGATVGPHSRVIPKEDSFYWLEYREGGNLETILIVKGL